MPKQILKTPSEAEEQIKFVVWLKKQGIRVAASANGGSRNLLEALKFKNMGVSPGFPDLFIPAPCGGYTGLFIEMKRTKGGKVSPEQQEWLTYLRGVNYYCSVAYGFEEAKEIFSQYASLCKKSLV